MNNRTIQKQQVQETEQIPAELVSKFDNDEQLVREFLSQGYSMEELQQSKIIHPTKLDPIVMIGDHIAGFYIETTGKNYKYQP